jgi:dihydrofolate reductase
VRRLPLLWDASCSSPHPPAAPQLARPRGELQVHGSGSLVRWLFDNQLVDEIILLTYPVVVGQGTRLFPATGPDTALELVDSRATSNGVTIQVYRPSGRPQYA